jgi:hypothetical protein
MLAKQAEDLDGLVVGRSEPVGVPGVELGDFSRLHGDVMLADDETELPRDHEEPLIAFVDAELGLACLGRDDDLPGLRAVGLLGKRDHRTAVALVGGEMDARVADVGRGDKLVERDAVGLGPRLELNGPDEEGHAAMDMTVIRDIIAGLLIAGAVGAWVPDSFLG